MGRLIFMSGLTRGGHWGRGRDGGGGGKFSMRVTLGRGLAQLNISLRFS